MRCCLLLLLLFCSALTRLHADGDGPAFDLTGPKVDVHVKRGDVTLPIAETPNLLPGDRLWIHPDFPESQYTHFVLVVAFLRGSTNQPPPDWFTRVETWNHDVRDEGVFVTVPAEAQQALIFLAPETGGDFNTLRKAVVNRPGSFVRATQDLQVASWDRMRLEAYLAEVKVSSQTDPKLLKERAELAARSLGIRLDQQCFDKPTDQQAPCLTQHTDALVLDDTNAQSMINQLATGSTLDLVNQISYTNMAGGGLYSPYVGAIVDTAKILSSLHTAHFQYIPALALPTADTLNLRLNTPPSFHDPKSVVVVALPPVGPSKPPPLHPVNPADGFCAEKPGVVLPVEGAPLFFATQLSSRLTLHIETLSDGRKGAQPPPIDLPVKLDPSRGGIVLDSPDHPVPPLPAGELTGVLRGKWGFDNWEGPRFHLFVAQPGKWTFTAADQSALVVGREDTLQIEGQSAQCVDRIEEQVADSKTPLKLSWKSPKPDAPDIAVAMPMKNAAPGPVTLNIYEFGLPKPDALTLQAYAEAASLERLTLSAGDKVALLKGTRLDEVATADLGGVKLTPSTLSRIQDLDQLAMNASASTSSLEPGKHYVAKVALRDGRELKAPVTVNLPRPQIALLNKGTQDDASAPPSPVHLANPDDLPVGGRLVFFLKSVVPASFPRDQKVEVAAEDGSFRTVLSLTDGSLMLENTTTALGSVTSLARFGPSAFGPVQVRAISADGATGDWLPLGTFVRLPAFKELHCPRAVTKPCTLSGGNLFLATSIAATQDFDNSTEVPPDFTGTQLSVPHPANGVLYLKLRDDPETVQTLTLPVLPSASQQGLPPTQPAGQIPLSPPPAATPTNPPATASDSTTTPPAVNQSNSPAAR